MWGTLRWASLCRHETERSYLPSLTVLISLDRAAKGYVPMRITITTIHVYQLLFL